MMDPWFVASLLGLFLLTFVGGGAIPMPVSLAVVALAAHHGADGSSHPYFVVAVATIGAVVGWYLMGTGLYHFTPQNAMRMAQQATPTWLKVLTQRFPTATVWVMNALPLPWDPVRLMLVAHKVHPKQFIVPLAAGRLVRYSGLVWLGSHMARFKTVALLLTVVLGASIAVKACEGWWRSSSARA
jgi:hypothetical protein